MDVEVRRAGAIVFGNLGIMDGVNEKGLAVGAFYFPTMAEYTPTTADNQAKSMSSIDFSNWILTQFASVDEVRAAIESGEAIVAPTLLPGLAAAAAAVPLDRLRQERQEPRHRADRRQARAQRQSARRVHQLAELRLAHDEFAQLHRAQPARRAAGEVRRQDLRPLRHGRRHARPAGRLHAAVALRARRRVQRHRLSRRRRVRQGCSTASTSSTTSTSPSASARESEDGKTYADMTMFTVMRDPQNLRMYYKTYDDQTIRMVDLNRFDLDAKEVKKLSTKSDQPVVDMSGKFQTRKTAANAQ